MLSRWRKVVARRGVGRMIGPVRTRKRGRRLRMMAGLGLGIVLGVATRRAMGRIAGRVVSIALLAVTGSRVEGRGDRACWKDPACYPSVGRPLLVGRGVEPRWLS